MIFRVEWKLLSVLVLSLLFTTYGQAQVWTSIGPTPLVGTGGSVATNAFAGRVTSIAVDPGDPTHWLLGTASGGVWEAHDTGTSWIPVTDGQPTLTTGAVTFAPSDSRIIYVGTGEANFISVSQSGLGILKSSDRGASWTLLGASSFARGSVAALRVDPTEPSTLLAATSRGGAGRDQPETVPSPPPFGILRSTDGGKTWVRTLAGQTTALEIDPTNFRNQYAAIGEPRAGVFNDTPGAVVNGLYRSPDGGQTWSPIAGPWGTSTSVTTAATGRIGLALAPSNPNVLYASVQSSPNGGGINAPLSGLFRTDNAWAAAPTWLQIPTDAIPAPGYCNQCAYAHVISVDPSDPNVLFAGGLNLWKCQNCGNAPSWSMVLGGSDYHSLVWAGSRLIAGKDQGLFSTTDGGNTWESHNASLSSVQFYGGALHPTTSSFILGGTQDNLAVKWTGGVAWERMIGSLGGFCEGEVAISSSRPDTSWMCAYTQVGINRTTDGLQSWQKADTGIDYNGAHIPIPVRKCPGNDDVFVAGTNRMWRSDNFFSAATASWVTNSPADPYPFPFAPNAPGTIYAIEFNPSDSTCSTYVYGNRGTQIQMTTDGGKTWRDLDRGKTLPPRPINAIAVDPVNSNVLYVALSSFDDGTPGKPGHVFKTTNAMSAAPVWSNISPPANLPFNVIRIDPKNPNSVYAGADSGIWHSANGGGGWQRLGPATGLPNAPIYDLKFDPTTGAPVVFTYGRGAFRLDPNAIPVSGPILAISTTATLNGATGTKFLQTLISAGGQGPYVWSLGGGTLPPGLTLSTDGSIFGTPTAASTYTFTIVVTDAAGGVATQTYTLSVIAAPPLTRSGVLSQIAAGGGWTTEVSLSNSSSSAVIVSIQLHAEDGTALSLPESITQQGAPQTATAASITVVINPNATVVVSMEDQGASTSVGWADVLSSSGSLSGFAIFRYTSSPGTVSEGTAPLVTQFPTKVLVPYDNTGGFSTGMALVNLSTVPVSVTATLWNATGSSLGTQSIALVASGHASFFFPDKFSATTGNQGFVTLQSNGSSGLTAVGLRFSPFGTFTSVPVTPIQ
jgi:photosystem II stability/assembly factor-like uncharacterized protein